MAGEVITCMERGALNNKGKQSFIDKEVIKDSSGNIVSMNMSMVNWMMTPKLDQSHILHKIFHHERKSTSSIHIPV